MASEIILAPDCPMRFPCRLREGRKKNSGLDTGCSRIPSGFKRSSPALHQPPASLATSPRQPRPHVRTWSQRTLALRAPRQPGEQLQNAPGELEGLIQLHLVVFWGAFDF